MTYIPYPRSLYRKADDGEVYHDVPCAVLTVDSAEEETAALADGWFNSPTEAEAGEAAEPKPKGKARK